MKILEENKNPLDIFCEASRILNEAVYHTLGPNGTNTAIQNSNGMYEIINDGKSIIEKLTCLDEAISPALETLKQASFETNRKAGDGTTSTTVIMNALLQGARDYLKDNKDINPVELKNKLDNIKEALLNKLYEYKQDLKEEDYEKVATVALGSDKYSDLVADTYRFLNKGDRPTLLKSDISGIEVEKIDGVCLDKISIVSNLFLNTTEYRDVDIVFLFEPVNRFQEITQLLRKIQSTGKETILFYNQLSSDILENILFNYTNGAIKLIPISLAGFGKGTYTIMEELADYCGGTIIDNTTCKVSEISKIFFGTSNYIVINNSQIIIKNDSKKIEKNYVHLKEKSILIRLGGTNVVEREEVFKRIEDAINSLGNAIEYGIVPGAGVSYSYLINSLENIEIPIFVKHAMNLINTTLNIKNINNIYDSAMVVKQVIDNAFSIVSQVITTHVVIHENIR